MNISQHAYVPYTRFVYGFYNQQGILSPSQSLFTTELTRTFGTNSYLLFNIAVPPKSASIKFFYPYFFISDSNGSIQLDKEYSHMCVQYSLGSQFFVRVVGYFQSSSLSSLLLSRLTFNNPDLI